MSKVKLNSRVKFPRGKQKKFLEDTLDTLDIKLSGLAKISNVCDRTLRDWKREKYNIGLSSLESICEKMKINLPKDVKILPEYWSVEKASKLGGRRHVELYGSPGTPESRRKGGLITQKKFRSDPRIAKSIGFIIRKKIKHPRKSSPLAEFIGIMLGDGAIRNDYQISISFNPKKDLKYANYIKGLITKLFSISSTIMFRKKYGSGDVVVSSRNLVEFLQKMGIKKGNKVANQVDVPSWIFENKKYQIGCLRGLFDTDGCIYQHSYTVGGKKYRYIKMCFRNYSFPILRSLQKILNSLGFRSRVDRKQKSVYLHSSFEVRKYFKTAGTSNPRYYHRYNKYFSRELGRLRRGV